MTLFARASHIRQNSQANLFRRFQIDDELELLRPLHREIYGFGNLISVVALFVGCATMAVFFRRLLIWDCST